MILPLHDAIRAQLADTVARLYEIDRATLPRVVLEYPPTRALGDLACPIAFELARLLRKAPRAIAADLVAALEPGDDVIRFEAAANGYVNMFLARERFLRDRLADPGRPTQSDTSGSTVIVEHTAINPNKAAHVGHLRNATLGDTLGNLLRFFGARVEIQNYIDDTGVQVADVVVGCRELAQKGLTEIREIATADRFDYYCWELYARVTSWYEEDPERLRIRAATLRDIERGGNENAELGAFIADQIVRRHLETMRRLGVDYDLLTWEGDILRLQFWDLAFEILTREGVVFKQDEGKLAGCWVMPIQDDPDKEAGPSNGQDDSTEASEDEGAREKVIVRSDGTVTYIGKDLANQFWKFGLLGVDFHYRVFSRRSDGSPLWATSAAPTEIDAGDTPIPRFAQARAVYNVIDSRQSYLQALLQQALRALGHEEQAEHSTHFAYEMVALSPATARELGYDEAADGQAFVEVSGRKGLGVKADDLLDRLVEKAQAEVAARNVDMPEAQTRDTANAIATAALRYFMIKYSRGKIIAFDLDEALSFEGETGPYLQYAVVRANNIFAKLQERDGLDTASILTRLGEITGHPLTDADGHDELWDLALQSARLDEVAQHALRTLELSSLAKYAFGLAQRFNGFYHRYPILNEPQIEAKLWRAAVAAYFRIQMTRALELMGCRVPTRM